MHLGYLGCYGNDWVATPNLDRLAAEGIAFDQHLVDHPELALSADLLQRSAGSGRYSWAGATGIASGSGEVVTLPGGICCRRVVCPTLADFAGAGEVVSSWQGEDCPVLWLEGPSLVPPWSLPEDLLSIYCERDEEEEDEALAPWPDPPLGAVALSPDELLRLQDTYAAVVTYWDALLGNLLEKLRASGRLDEMVVWITARAGLPLGEHGHVGVAAPLLHEELVHVPLLWRMPHATEAGRRVPGLTQPVDLVPTLGELLGMPSADVQGHSLRPLVLGHAEQVRAYACATLGEDAWLLRTPEWAFHLPRSEAARLYVKPDDRWEVNDVRPRQPELAERLEAVLRAFDEAVRRPGALVYPALAEDTLEIR